MIYEVRLSARFKRDYKRMQKLGKATKRLRAVVTLLANDEALPESLRDHALGGDYIGYSECHIAPDWLLIYKKENSVLVLTLVRTGSHSDLLE